ncbi:hypothetical protein [Ktedonospora formicarum]|uniref:hypothetical protein n=1 Tax=Ktedonospora formicarum TaxID=2778364 RepID=UPI001C68CB15|nr:hypothetical protein [Ktedonospora formicarum]
MNILEAISILHRVRTKDGPHHVIIIDEDESLFRQASIVVSDEANYPGLCKEQGQAIARQAITLVEHKPSMQRYLCHTILEALAKYVPGALEEVYPQILEQNLFFDSGLVFQDAQADTRDLLLSLLETKNKDMKRKWLTALAWIRDEVAVETFRAWRLTPPIWYQSTDRPIESFTRYAGWEFTTEGAVRDLYFHDGYELLSHGLVEEEQAGSMKVFQKIDQTCCWCGRPMVTGLDIDQSEDKLSFLTTHIPRLRFLFCINCSVQENIFSNLTDGGWSKHTPHPPYPLNPHYWEGMEECTLQAREHVVLGNRGHATGRYGRYWIGSNSQLGGLPQWVQEPDYPQCPSCKQCMLYLGQVEIGDVDSENDGSGVLFFFLCPTCQLGVYDIQCT